MALCGEDFWVTEQAQVENVRIFPAIPLVSLLMNIGYCNLHVWVMNRGRLSYNAHIG
jgi:hypothetical protein